ncbi:FAD-binding oxidoreductase, partial [Candidatus Poribacteria bacterium]|nr:FAD-binding oxidoreductase [Candidatus Poribacteria bacterium]
MIKSLTIEQKDELEEIFGFSRGTPCGCPRVSFDFIDCSLYSHDIASIPSLVEKIIIKTPKAVVQPINSEEIIKLIKFAHKNQIHLTPRGAGTSGYGGVIPILGGIIVDFSRMNKVINIDPNNLTVTVEPGIRWKDLENIIKPYGLALCTYPSSGLASTVGGWLAQGGTGFGGYEHGFFIHSVKSATLITPDCQKQEFTESDLYKVSDLEGITGFITQVVLKLKKYSDVKLAISAFPNVETMIQAITNINEQKIPLWHMAYESPLYIKYLMQLNNSKMYPPDKYILICGYHADLENVIKYQLIKTFNQNQGEILSDETASSHWNSRWYPMRIKRLGPSMISSEIIIDFKHLEEFLKKITNSIPEMSIHGSIVKDNKAIALGFALDDERNPEFTNNNKKSLQMIELAESFGGRVYNLGMYFHDKAHSVLGENRYNSIKEYKQKIDPHDIFNPGKVILMKGEHDASTHLKSAIRASHFMGNSLSSIAGTLLSQKIKLPDNFPEKIFDEAFICSSCGFCRTDCPIYNATYLEKFSPRGKFNIIKQITKNNMDYSQEIADIFSF